MSTSPSLPVPISCSKNSSPQQRPVASAAAPPPVRMAEVALSAAEFADQAARAKFALNAQFVFALAFYPFVLGITMTTRGSWMSSVNPRPHFSGTTPASPPRDAQDMWVTDDALTIASTIVTFMVVLVAHYLLLCHLTLKRLPGSPRMCRPCSAVSGFGLLLSTTGYYINYLRSSRYGVSPVEWSIFAVFTSILVIMTVLVILIPLNQKKVVLLGQA